MNIQEKIREWITKTLEIKEDFVLAHPKDLKNGDYSFFHSTAKENDFGKKLNENKIPEIDKVEIVGNFINFYLSKEFFAESIKEINKPAFAKASGGQRRVLIEHTQPNPFKEFHIGHLMNNAIGESISRIIESDGAKVIDVGYHGDVGLHVAKAIWGIIKKRPNSFLGAYADGHEAYENNENAKKEIIEINKEIYDGSNNQVNTLYQAGKDDSLNYFESLYKRLDSHFDHHFYESEAGRVGKEIVLKNVGKVFEESEGAIIFRGENFEPETHTRVFINSDGIPTYEAKEVGLAKLKKEKYEYDESITVTANEQDSFFDVTEVAIGEVFPELKGKLRHLSHGMIKLPSGKMSSRTGDVITAESLIEQVKEKVAEKLADRNYTEEQKQSICEIVAIGAIKYSILRQAIGGDIIFDFDKSISFEGDSGPYLQYTAVRANSVLEKSKNFSSKNTASEIVLAAPVTDLERYLYRFPEVVRRAAGEYAPHYVVTYLTELASMFNSFYATHRIIENPVLALSEQSESNGSPYKIALTSATHHILRNGLSLLGIKVPERM